MADKTDIIQEILKKIPQQRPFRFVDELIEVSEKHSIGRYTFREDEFFYAGHFPERPITPGVILIECMAQIGLIPISLYRELSKSEHAMHITVLAETEAEFYKPVYPGSQVTVKGEVIFLRHSKVKGKFTMNLENGGTVASGTAAGFMVAADSIGK